MLLFPNTTLLLVAATLLLVPHALPAYRVENIPPYGLTAHQPHADGYATLHIYFPLSRTVSPFSLFLNRKPVAQITNGKRVSFRAVSEGSIAVTIISGTNYVEPGALAKNHRILTIKRGKEYYFEVNDKGMLAYKMNPADGREQFNNDRDYIGKPELHTETLEDPLPTLNGG